MAKFYFLYESIAVIVNKLEHFIATTKKNLRYGRTCIQTSSFWKNALVNFSCSSKLNNVGLQVNKLFSKWKNIGRLFWDLILLDVLVVSGCLLVFRNLVKVYFISWIALARLARLDNKDMLNFNITLIAFRSFLKASIGLIWK